MPPLVAVLYGLGGCPLRPSLYHRISDSPRQSSMGPLLRGEAPCASSVVADSSHQSRSTNRVHLLSREKYTSIAKCPFLTVEKFGHSVLDDQALAFAGGSSTRNPEIAKARLVAEKSAQPI